MKKRNQSMANALSFVRTKGLPVSYIIDVGILYCTEALVKVYPDIRHFLIEPVRSYYERIESFYASNNIDYVLVEAALSDQSGVKKLLEYGADGGNSITHSVIVNMLSNYEEDRVISSVLVEALTIGDILIKYGKGITLCEEKFLLKMDIDGLEDKILSSSSGYIDNCICIVLEMPISNFFQRMQIVNNLGFEMVDIVDPCYYKGGLSQVDVIFVRSEYINQYGLNTWYGNKVVDFSQWQSFDE